MLAFYPMHTFTVIAGCSGVHLKAFGNSILLRALSLDLHHLTYCEIYSGYQSISALVVMELQFWAVV